LAILDLLCTINSTNKRKNDGLRDALLRPVHFPRRDLAFFIFAIFLYCAFSENGGVKCGLHLRLAVIYLLRAEQSGVHEMGVEEERLVRGWRRDEINCFHRWMAAHAFVGEEKIEMR
jgi:hypothetical protein